MKYNLQNLGITALNPMQQEMLQASRKSNSIVLLSPTGSGKTLAYLLPLIESIRSVEETFNPTALIIVPSRELAIQTQEVLQKVCNQIPSMACYGGRPAMEEHRKLLSLNPRIIIGTPGRILDHIQKDNFAVSEIETLIIDEFDKSLELGFHQQISDILAQLSSVRKRVLLSATDNPHIPEFVGIQDVHRIDCLGDADTDYSDRISQNLVRSPQKDKLETLSSILCNVGSVPSIVFLNYREAVDRVYRYLSDQGFNVVAFHGAMEQKDRERALFRFQSGSANILVSTDLASRGLDIDGVENIIHYHLPMNQETYIHRNGRTARWDRVGNSIIILGPEETIEKFVDADAEITEIPVPATRTISESRWETLYIGKGKKDKINKVDIVGFLCKQGGLTSDQLGMIKIFPDWSFVAVERRQVRKLLNTIKGLKIKGKKTIIEPIK